MANQRQQKKNQKNEKIKIASRVLGTSTKQAKKLSNVELDNIVSRERKRENRNAKQRAQRAENKALIEKYGLKGVKPSDSPKKIQEAIKAQEREKAKEAAAARRAKIKERNRQILSDAGVPFTAYPPKWYEMGEAKLRAWIEAEQDDDKIIDSGDVWLYIGYGDLAGHRVFMGDFTAGGMYGKMDNSTLRERIANKAAYIGETTSSGRAGHVVVSYGEKDDVRADMQSYEFFGYQTIFYGNQLTEHAFLTYMAAALDNCPEENRETIVKSLNGYLNMAAEQPDKADLNKMKVDVTVKVPDKEAKKIQKMEARKARNKSKK